MLVRAHSGAVNHGVFIVRIGRQYLEHSLPHAARCPARKSRMNLDWVPEAFRQVSPGNAGPVTVKHRLDKQPIVPGGRTDMPFTTRQKVSYTLPLIVTEGIAAHRSTPNQVDLP